MSSHIARFIAPALLCAALIVGCAGREDATDEAADQPVSGVLEDAYGKRVVVPASPDRIVSLAPNVTEFLAFVGAGNQLVGRTDFCDYPPHVDTVASVGRLHSFNLERIVALDPDLVIMTTFDGSNRELYDRLKALGLTVYAVSEGPVDHVIENVKRIGAISGHRKSGQRLRDSLRVEADALRSRASQENESPVRTFIVINRSPLMTTSGGFIGNMIEDVGGVNVAGDDPVPYPTYSRELLVEVDPDVVLVPGESENAVDELIESHPVWSSLTAYRTGRIRFVPQDLIARPGPRIVDGMKAMYRAIHGEEAAQP